MARTHHAPLNEWYPLNAAQTIWRYRQLSVDRDTANTITLIQFVDGEWEIHINDHKIASAGSLAEAKALCPMLIKFHGEHDPRMPNF